jgi:hypothetical protein
VCCDCKKSLAPGFTLCGRREVRSALRQSVRPGSGPPWLTEFFYRTSSAYDRITEPKIFGDGSVAHVETRAELEQQVGRPDFVSHSDPDRYRPQLSATIRSHLPPELQQEVLAQLGPQSICEVIVACFGRCRDKAWDDICVRALEESVKRWVLVFVQEALKDDVKQARTPHPVDQFCWEDVRENVPSPLWGFAGVPEDLFAHVFYWRRAGFFRAKDEKYNLQRSLEPPPSPPESPGSWDAWSVYSDNSIGGPTTGWGSHE